MAGENLNVWYDPEGDHVEIVFDQKAGTFEETSLENVMCKRDAEGNLLSISVFNLSSFAATRPHPESTTGHGLWAVFNLDIDNPDNFDFDVALGYERRGEGLEGVSVAPADARETCLVFFHADRSSPRRVAERTLEIIHKRLPSPVISIGEDPLSPIDLTSLCRDQVVLALRLFQSRRFFVFPRERRDEGRVRAFHALAAHQAGTPAPYVLRDRQVTRFREFATKLHAFHVDRNRYRWIRRDPAGPLLSAAGAKFFKRVARLMIATDLFEQASESHVSGDIQLMWLVMAAEALFTDDDKSEVSYRLATRMAVLNGADVDDVKRHWDLVRAMYDARSRLVHGTAYVGKPSKRLAGLVGDAGFIEPTPDHLSRFNNLVRASILYFIAFQDSEQQDVLEILDRSVFDPSEVGRLRRMANTYWGLTGCEEEMLCSGRWAA